MAHGTKYYFEAPAIRAGDYRCELQKDGYTSGATEITRDMGSLKFVAGRGGLDYFESVMPSRAEITIRDQSIIREIYGSRDTLWRANILRRPTDSDPWALWFRGFILGDMGRFDPGSFKGPSTLEAVDALELLKNIDRPLDGGTLSHQVWQLIDDALGATGLGLDYNINFPWFYRLNESPDSELTASDQKLQTLYVEEVAHQKDREKPPGDGELKSHYDILRTALKTLNLRLVQGGGEWWIRQRHQARYGATPTHNYTVGTATPNSTTNRDFVVDLDTSGARVEERPSNYHRNLGEFTVIHDFGPYTGRGLPEGNLESISSWTLNSQFTGGGAIEYEARHIDHNNFAPSQDATQSNSKLVSIVSEWTGADSFFNPALVSDPFSFPSSGRSDEVLRLSFMHACVTRQDDYVQAVQVEHGGYWLTNFQVSFSREVRQGSNVRIPCSDLDAPIPEGTVLWVHAKNNIDSPLDDAIRITLTEDAQAGQSYLQADLPEDLVPSNFFENDPIARPFTWTTSQTNALFHYQFEVDRWAEQRISAFMQTQQSDGGETVTGDEMTLKFGYGDRDSNAGDFLGNSYMMAIDEVSLRLTVGGSEVVQAEFLTQTDEVQSDEDETTTYMGDGPSADSSARFFYFKNDIASRQELLQHWDTSPFAGQDGLRLGHLRGREYIRELREKHRGMRLRVHLTAPDQVFQPKDLLLWDGQYWSIESYKHIPDSGYIDVDVLPILDEGTQNLTYTAQLTVGDQSTSGSSSTGGGGSVIGGGGAVSSIFGAFISRLPSTSPKDVFGVPVPVGTTIEYDPSNDAIAKAFTAPPSGTSAKFEILFDNLDGGTTTTTTVGTVEFASGATSGTWTPSITNPITAEGGDELRVRFVTTADYGGKGFRISLPITLS